MQDNSHRFIHPLRTVKTLKDVFYVRKKFIKHGYRAHHEMTYKKCTLSLFMLHNETVNVWSHLLCGLYYLYNMYLIIQNEGYYKELHEMSSKVIQMFACISCIFCMISSSIYHLYNSMSRAHYNALLKLDLIGIGFKITGLAATLIYTGFHNYKGIGHPMAIVLGLMMTSNLLLQMTPCYMQEKYS